MHPNAGVLERFFTALNRHDHDAMADCYDSAATFRDIAFDLRGRREIHGMWRMICSGDITATFEIAEVNDAEGRARVVDEYTFNAASPDPEKRRRVKNVISSRFRFRDGLIIAQADSCDAREWARQALGGLAGVLAGRIRFLRSWTARKKLRDFVRQHPVSAASSPAE